MAELPLNGKRGEGRVVLIDDADLPQVSQHRWHLGKDGYPRTSVGGRSTTLHRLLSRPGEDMLKDHISGDKLDNRRSNLRACTQQENSFNRRRHRNNSSGYKGVTRWKGKWRAVIHLDGKQRFLGLFTHPLLAAVVYNGAARALYGEFAQLNDVSGLDDLIREGVAHAGD